MPNRILREGILESEAVCSLQWGAEVFYRRLMSVVDDYGRFHATPKLLRANLYPLQIDKVSDADIGKWLTQVVEAGLVSVYPAADGKRYVQIMKFGQQVRSKSKFPEPDGSIVEQQIAPDSNCSHPQSNAPVFGGVVEDGCGGEVATRPVDLFPEFWATYPRKVQKVDAEKAFEKLNVNAELLAVMLAAVRTQRQSKDWQKEGGQFIPYPASWLRGRRWEDVTEMPGSTSLGGLSAAGAATLQATQSLEAKLFGETHEAV